MERIVFMRVLRRTAILLPFLACFYGVFAQGAPEGAIIGDQGTNKLPSNLAYKHTFSQQIYTPQEVAAAMGYSTPTSCTIKSMVFSYKKTNAYDGAQRKWRIYLANVDKSEFNALGGGKKDFVTNATDGVTFTMVKEITFYIYYGNVVINFDTPFVYDATKNLLVCIADDYESATKVQLVYWDYFTYGASGANTSIDLATDLSSWTANGHSVNVMNLIDNNFATDNNNYSQSSEFASSGMYSYKNLIKIYTESYGTWVDMVTTRPPTFPDDATISAGGSDYYIPLSTSEDLAWFISYVNGYNGCSKHLTAKAKLTADIDMGKYIWVPIGYGSGSGSSQLIFKGVFDGQCHSISNIHIDGATEIGYVGTGSDMVYTGLFGYTDGATIKNTFVTNAVLSNKYGATSYMGGIVGYAKNNTKIEFCGIDATLNSLNKGFAGGIAGYLVNSSITASMASPNLIGKVSRAGSIAAQIQNGATVQDCYVNPIFNYTTINNRVSILVDIQYSSSDKINNSYIHYDYPFSSPTVAVGDKSGTVTNVFATAKPSYSYISSTFNAICDYSYGSLNNSNLVGTTPLVDVLNQNVTTGYKWILPKGSGINGGYPIITRATANDSIVAVATGGKAVRFGELNEMITNYKDVVNAEIYMYNNDTITVSLAKDDAAKLYVDENVALMQTAGKVAATVGVTFDNSAQNGEMLRDWHCFSTSLKNAPLGIKYLNSDVIAQSAFAHPALDIDYEFDENGYFPSGITNADWFDFYGFSEQHYHWINFKRNSASHWYQDNPTTNIDYVNEDTLVPGKGYLIALGNATADTNFMQARGILNNGEVSVPVTAIGAHLTGYNFLGNPYQSYLDFDKFAEANKNLWNSASSIGYKAYLVYNADLDRFVEYLVDDNGAGFSINAAQGGDAYINMHQGFFVVKNGTATNAVFDNTMRVTNQTPHFRNEAPAYPLVNLFCTGANGKSEVSVIEFERPVMAGSLKMKRMMNCGGSMYVHWNDEDFGSVFIDHMPEMVPVWFEAANEGVFTLSWNTANADFEYMHLIDNKLGTDTDCLTSESYTFEAAPTDSNARFRLVFAPNSGDGVEETVMEKDFAFFDGSQLVVNGYGLLQVVDLNGRIVAAMEVVGQQGRISLPEMPKGVYLLRLANGKGVRVQKIVK